MSALRLELRVMRGLAACRGDDAAIDAAERELDDMVAALRAAERTITKINPSIVGLPDHPTLVKIRAALAHAENRS